VEKESQQIDRALARVSKELPQCKAPENVTAMKSKVAGLKDKVEFLKMRTSAVESAGNEVVAAQKTLLGLYDQDLRDHYQKMRGLLSYGIATGRTNPDCNLLFDSLGDYLEAKSESDRVAAQKAVNLCLEHGNLGDKNDETGAGDEVLRRFESIEDPEQRSAFFKKHRDEIHRAFEARKNNNS
jgi:hypothetical protein